MLFTDFDTRFKQQVYQLTYEEGIDLSIAICKRLYFGYEKFVMEESWGDQHLLMDAIQLCESTKNQTVILAEIELILPRVEAVIPHTADFGNFNGTVALYAAASVYETLQFVADKDWLHIYNVGSNLINSIDCQVTEETDLTDEEIFNLPVMKDAMDFLLQSTAKHGATAASPNSGRSTKFNYKTLFNFRK